MHVIQFLDPLLPAPYIEIIKPPLPETAMHRGILPQTHLPAEDFPRLLPLNLRDTRCFNTCITTDGFAFFDSPINR